MSVELLPLSRVDEAARRAFYAAQFGERAGLLSEHWRWLYRIGWRPGVEPIAAVEGGRMVGQAGVIPGLLRLGGRVEPAIWFVDYALAPEHRGRGLGKTLAAEWMKLGPNRLTFCNEASLRVFVGLGWTRRDGAQCRFLPVRLSAAGRGRGALWRLAASALDGVYGAALRALLRKAPAVEPKPLTAAAARRFEGTVARGCAVERDADWARWRLLDGPWKDDYRLFERGGAFLVARGFVWKGVRRLHVVYASTGAEDVLRGAARWAVDNGVDWLWAQSNDPLLLSAAAPVMPGRYAALFAWHSDDTGARALLAESFPPLQGVDADNDLLLPPDPAARFWAPA